MLAPPESQVQRIHRVPTVLEIEAFEAKLLNHVGACDYRALNALLRKAIYTHTLAIFEA